jgi:Cft2 family RNA processing exonuclease
VSVADLFAWQDGLKLAGLDWCLDSRKPRPKCLVSHAHSDHLCYGDRGPDPDPSKLHGRAVCTPETAAIGRYRCGLAAEVDEHAFHKPFTLEPGVGCELLPAGHVLGSAMIHVERDAGSLLYTGDYKLRHSRTVPHARPRQADVLVMESTYGSPYFRFPPTKDVEQALVDLVAGAFAEGKQPVVHGYSLGKSQEIIRILTDAGFNVTQHGAVAAMSQFYRDFGVHLGRDDQLRRYKKADFSGSGQLDLQERGVLVCPPRDARGPMTQQFGDRVCRIMMSGWALSKNARFRYGVEHALPLSDHADWDEIVETIELVRPRHVIAHHGFADFPKHLHKLGLPDRLGFEVRLAKPPAQMELF